MRSKKIKIQKNVRKLLTKLKIGYKIREAQLSKTPYMLIVGDKEKEANAVGVRSRKEGDIGAQKLEEFISNIKEEIKNYGK